jgi:hypothetical protein
VVEEGHKLYGGFLTDEALGIGTENKPVVYTGEGFAVNDAVEKGGAEFSGKVRLATEEVLVKTSFTIYKETVFSKSVEEWASTCGVKPR